MAKLACTSACVIALVFLVMNLERLLTPMLLAWLAWVVVVILSAVSRKGFRATFIQENREKCLGVG